MDYFKDEFGIKFDLRVGSLGEMAPNQQMGFFLTPESPEVIFMGNNYRDLKENRINNINKKKQIKKKRQT